MTDDDHADLRDRLLDLAALTVKSISNAETMDIGYVALLADIAGAIAALDLLDNREPQ